MKIIQSFWSCNNPELLRTNAGWLAPEYKLMGWALSCLQLKQFYNNVILYADNAAARVMIDEIKLPYTDVVCNLDSLKNYDAALWALPKIYAYSQQHEPFLHVDGDAFTWEPFDDKLLQSGLIAQNFEKSTMYYENIMQTLERELTYFPEEITAERKIKNQIYAYNAGIFGGNDIDFFKWYTKKAFEFVDNNINALSRIDVTGFNIFFEQYLFYCLAKKENKTVNVLLNEIIADNEYVAFGSFTEVPHNKKYLHLLGQNKRNKVVCEHMADRLRLDYPEYYYRIIEIFRNAHVPLMKNFYFFQDFKSCCDLTERHKTLKSAYSDNAIQKESINAKAFDKRHPLNILSISRETSALIKKEKLITYETAIETYMMDLKGFCISINGILKNKFGLLSNDYLCGRDLNVTSYYQYLFENTENIYTKIIVADSIVEIIESKFDWSELIESGIDKASKTIQGFEKKSSIVYSAIIPECYDKGFTILNMDELDILIFKTLNSPLTIKELLDVVENSFDPEELKNARTDYEMLIFDRIETGIQFKIIRVLF